MILPCDGNPHCFTLIELRNAIHTPLNASILRAIASKRQVLRGDPRDGDVAPGSIEVSTSAPNALRLRYVASSFVTSLGKIDD